MFNWVYLDDTVAGSLELLIGKQYCFAVVKNKLKLTAEIIIRIVKCNKSRLADFSLSVKTMHRVVELLN